MSRDIEPVKGHVVQGERKKNRSETMPDSTPPVEVGQWYRVTGEKGPWFGCVVHIGSNYYEMSSTDEGTCRIHVDDFFQECKLEENPDAVIDKQVNKHQTKVNQLMGRVVEVTQRLGVSMSAALPQGSETMALATTDGSKDFGTYKTDLVKAKKETLPELFQEIEDTNRNLVTWLKAKTVPFKAKVRKMKGVIGRIDDRIFNVEIYAGLTERCTQIQDGEPASIGEKIRLIQRRHYMDEECLAKYETGGMEFKDLHDFDTWLIRPDNLSRLLPFERCIVSFQVRRDPKKRSTFGDFVRLFEIMEEMKGDTVTCLYIKNGEKVFRLNTALDFGPKLFPDMDTEKLVGKMWAKIRVSSIEGLITDNEYQVRCQEYDREKAEYEKETHDLKVRRRLWERAKRLALANGEEFTIEEPYVGIRRFWEDNPREDYKPFEPNNIFYDDVREKVQGEMQKHNRIGLVLQGLLDRSLTLHPHPPWQIWTAEGFREALELVYDESRALVAGPKPDFQAFWKKMNESMKKGSVTVNQQIVWEMAEAEKYEKAYKGRERNYWPERYCPPGNEGPGTVAVVAEYASKAERCTYAWNRKAQSPGKWGEPVRTSFTCDAERVFCVDDYKPGDFRQFFNDPRTRAEYLEWAPMLLEAEEYHAGNRKIPPPVAPQPKKEPSWERQQAYQRMKDRKAVDGKAVRNKRKVETKGGKVYERGLLWRVQNVSGGKVYIVGITPDGIREEPPQARSVYMNDPYDLEIDASIPAAPKRVESS